jgi:hypothetical protein
MRFYVVDSAHLAQDRVHSPAHMNIEVFFSGFIKGE